MPLTKENSCVQESYRTRDAKDAPTSTIDSSGYIRKSRSTWMIILFKKVENFRGGGGGSDGNGVSENEGCCRAYREGQHAGMTGNDELSEEVSLRF